MEMQLTMNMDESDIKEACAQWAAARMPEIPGYRLEVDIEKYYGYLKKADVKLVKIEESADAAVDP